MSNEKGRINFFGLLALGLLVILAGRVGYLQVVKGNFFSDYVSKQAKGVVESSRGRGFILDRGGEPLAMNKKSASLYVFPAELKDRKLFVRRLKKAGVKLSKSTVRRILKQNRFVWIERNIDIDRAERLLRECRRLNTSLRSKDFILSERWLHLLSALQG